MGVIDLKINSNKELSNQEIEKAFGSLAQETGINITSSYKNIEQHLKKPPANIQMYEATPPADDKGSKFGDQKHEQYLQEVTERILEQVRNNHAPWQQTIQPKNLASTIPINHNGRHYSGLNQINLMSVAIENNYTDNRWHTFKGALEESASVKKGEKGTKIHFWHKPDKDSPPIMKVFTVFNAEQIEGLPPSQLEHPIVAADRYAKAEAILQKSGVNIHHINENNGYESTQYSPSTDTITLPNAELFNSKDEYYSTALHELAHATGHESRLNRDLSDDFGSYSYTKEELRAQLAIMAIGQALQIGHNRSEKPT